ncbi:MAG TPA: response regulator transcription factor [Pyrinomonadaceae bacterium]|nr:response regulator transcription factor [Pyrinomonadaceae bacterium]
MTKLRIFLADDHAVLRDGLKALVNAQPDMEVVGEADNGRTASSKIGELSPDIVVMDVSMPELNGVRATEILKRECPQVKVLALTAYKDKAYLDQLLKVGALGYVLKMSAAKELIEALRVVASGNVYIDQEMTERIAEGYVRDQFLRGEVRQRELTSREEQILRLIAQGYANKEIAKQLDISVKTVESHKTNVMEKLELKSRTEIVRYAVRQGWLQENT